jgi:PBSX family phage terminase large subunit
MMFADYRPYGAALELFSRKDPEVGMSGPAGTGKSRGLLEKIHACSEKYDRCRVLLVRKTRTSLTNTTLVTFEQIVLPRGRAELNYQGARYPNGSVIDFGGMDKASKIMSSEYDIIAVPEATEFAENEWESMTTRLRWGRLPYQQMLYDCNPSHPRHWLKQRANAGKTVMLESRHEDNPSLWDGKQWTEKGKAYLSKLDALTGARYLRLRKGIWAAAEGMVYEGWDPAIHLVDRVPIPPEWPRVWSIDFGYTNPFVCQFWARDPDGRMWRYREFYRTQRIVEDHAKDIRELCRREHEPVPRAILCDHDAEDRATFERHIGLLTLPAFKGISAGIQAVQARLRKAGDGRPRLLFLRDSLVERDEALFDAKRPTCTEEEIDAYVWPPGAANRETPVDRDNHGMDAMRYAVAAADGVQYDPSKQGVPFETVAYPQISVV